MGNTAQTREIEIKLSLASAAEHQALADRLAPRTALLEQVNLYFDTPDDALRSRGWSVRCRRENGAVSLTVKASRRDLGEFMDRNEWTGSLEAALWPDLLSGARPAGPLLVDLLRREGVSLPEGLDVGALRPLGCTETQRQVFALPGGGAALRVELDTTSYPDGAVLHELELEVPGPSTEEATRRLRELFDALGIPWRVSKVTKQARFREALKKRG